MSITLEGSLSIKSVMGSRGAFSVGDLVTEVGNFRIKDALLDEFDPGTYRGKFVVGSIYPFSYTWRGRVSIEVRAKLLEIFLDDVDKSEVPVKVHHLPDPAEVDPIDEEGAPPRMLTPKTDDQTDTERPPAPQKTGLFDDELLGLIEAGGPIKLDPTVDRQLFRQQRDALKSAGFRFDASAQHWLKIS